MVHGGKSQTMKKPFAISIGLFLFLFGLAFAKTSAKSESADKQLRVPATVLRAE